MFYLSSLYYNDVSTVVSSEFNYTFPLCEDFANVWEEAIYNEPKIDFNKTNSIILPILSY